MLNNITTINNKIKKGTTPTIELVLKQDGQIFDLTNCTAVFKWRKKESSTKQTDIVAIINNDPTTGIIYVNMTVIDTTIAAGTYLFEVFVTNTVTGKIYAFPINKKDKDKNDFMELTVVDSI
jgi:hypothetical protein